MSRTVNRALLSRDLIRMGRLSWFYNQFAALTADKGLHELAGASNFQAHAPQYSHPHRCNNLQSVPHSCPVGRGRRGNFGGCLPCRAIPLVCGHQIHRNVGVKRLNRQADVNYPGFQPLCLGEDCMPDGFCGPPRCACSSFHTCVALKLSLTPRIPSQTPNGPVRSDDPYDWRVSCLLPSQPYLTI